MPIEYDLYHDESKEAGYWHGMLLVPRNARRVLLGQLAQVRTLTGYEIQPLSLKRVDRRNERFDCTQGWAQVGVAALRQKDGSSEAVHVRGARKWDNITRTLAREYKTIPIGQDGLIGARFILFRERDDHQAMDDIWFPDHGALVETTARMALKGGLNLFAASGDEIVIRSMHFDGYEHHGRQIDPSRIVGRMDGLRDSVRFADDINENVFCNSSDHRREDGQPYDDCQLLQLTDILVSGFRTHLAESKSDIQAEATTSLTKLIKRWDAGSARMANSRWHRGFCISQCYLESGAWVFEPIKKEQDDRQDGLGI